MLALVVTLLPGTLGSCDFDVRSPTPTSVAHAAFERDGLEVEVALLGEFQHSARFGPWHEVSPVPEGPAGAPEGEYVTGEPVWLEFEYRIGAAPKRRVLVAKRPIMRHVSWDANARAGAALGDDTPVKVGDTPHVQDARVRDRDGRSVELEHLHTLFPDHPFTQFGIGQVVRGYRHDRTESEPAERPVGGVHVFGKQ